MKCQRERIEKRNTLSLQKVSQRLSVYYNISLEHTLTLSFS